MPPELAVPGPRWARFTTDAVGVVGAASFVVAWRWGPAVIALFGLVLLGLTVPRVARLPALLQIATGAGLLLGAWAATLGWYAVVPHLDLIVHALATGLLAVVAVLGMQRARMLPHPVPRLGTIIVTAAVGALLAVIWEAGEWSGHTWIDASIGVGYDDTVGDLVTGVLGSALGGAMLAVKGGRDG